MIALIVAEQIFVDDTLNNTIIKIDELRQQIEVLEKIDTPELKTMIDDLDEFWISREQWLCLSINHNELNKMGEQIKKVKVYIEQNNKDDCVYEVDVLAFYAESYKHVLQLNIQNIF